MHASYQIIIQALWLAYIAHKHCILNLKLMQMQESIWICTHQMQSIKFMSLLPLLVCFSCPRIWSPSILQCCSLLIHVHICTLISLMYLSNLCPNKHIFTQISPPLSSMTIKGLIPYEICAIWRSRDTTWRFCHENLLWLDAKSWTWVDGWVLNLYFWWTHSSDWYWHHL